MGAKPPPTMLKCKTNSGACTVLTQYCMCALIITVISILVYCNTSMNSKTFDVHSVALI